MDLGVWLRSLGLEQYEATFRENAIDDAFLPGLTAENLKDLGIVIVGHRRKLLDAIAALRADTNAKVTGCSAERAVQETRNSNLVTWPPTEIASYTSYIVVCILCLYWYINQYIYQDARPGKNPLYPIGWFGWFDQSRYLDSVHALLKGDFSATAYFYPPLYPVVGALFAPISFGHEFFIPDALSLLVFVIVLLWVSGQLYGRWLCALTIAATFFVFPLLTTLQWVIPWTTSLSALWGSLLIAIFFWFSRKDKSWVITSPTEWGGVAGFYLTYGAIFPTRPLDLLVFFPLALLFFLKVTAANYASRGRHPLRRVFQIVLVVGGSGLFFPAAYAAFNTCVFGSAFGGYFASVGQHNGYVPANLFMKMVSILLDSHAIYIEKGQALVDEFWPAYITFPVLVVSAFSAPLIIRIVSITILLQYVLYLPFGELFPTGLFRFWNVHYFKWTLPWMAVITVGQIITWMSIIAHRRMAWGRLAATTILCLLWFNLDLTIPAFKIFDDHRNGPKSEVTIDLKEKRLFDVLDMRDANYPADLRSLSVDGSRRRPPRDFKLLYTPWGMRVVLLQPAHGRQIHLYFDPSVSGLKSGVGTSRIGSYRFSLFCRVGRCPAQSFDAKLPSAETSSGRFHKFGTAPYRLLRRGQR